MNQVDSLLLQKMECGIHCQWEAYFHTEPKSTVYILFSKFILLSWQIYFITWWKRFWYLTFSTKSTYFYKFLTGKNFAQWFLILWWGYRFLTKNLWRIFIFVLILKQHEDCVMATSDSWWCYFSAVQISHCSMNECFLSMERDRVTLFEPVALITRFIRHKPIPWSSL